MSPALVSSETHSLAPVLPPSSADPLVRKQAVQDLMAQMQGTYNFMQVSSLSRGDKQASYSSMCILNLIPSSLLFYFGQDSMLEFDGQPLDPAIVSAQPMKSAQMVCAPGKDGNLHIHPKRSWTIESYFPVTKSFYKTLQGLEMRVLIAYFSFSAMTFRFCIRKD